MGDYTQILYEKQRQGVLITLNRPETNNAMTRTTQDEMFDAMDEAVADPDVRAIVLTGAGSAFSSGYDQGGGGSLRQRETAWPYGITEGMSASEYIDARRGQGRNPLLHLWELNKPVIGAVNGWAMGGGSWYALFSHMTIASENAVFSQPEVRHGSNTSFIWTLTAGFKNAIRYGITGDHIDAQEALRIGLVNKVVPHEELLDECFHIVERIALVPPETVKINLAIATMGLEMMGLRDALFMGSQLTASNSAMLREEYRRPLDIVQQEEGLRGFLQMRDGPFIPEPFGPRSRPRE